jgi:hypothetical protein
MQAASCVAEYFTYDTKKACSSGPAGRASVGAEARI